MCRTLLSPEIDSAVKLVTILIGSEENTPPSFWVDESEEIEDLVAAAGPNPYRGREREPCR